MTSSEKPEPSASQPNKDANQSSVSTQTVDDGTSEVAASVDDTTPVAKEQSGDADGEAKTASAEPAYASPSDFNQVLEGTDAPPPWQRASAAGTRTEVQPELGTEDTQKIPKTAQDQETVRTAVPGAGTEETSASQAARTSVSFAGADASRSNFNPGASTSSRRPSRGPRRASLQVKRIDPWSVLKLALVLSVAMFFVWMIAVAVLYGVLDGMGTWDQVNGTFTDLTRDAASEPLISAGRVFGIAAIIGGINIVLCTALATVAAFIYNVAADFAGGVELTLSERE